MSVRKKSETIMKNVDEKLQNINIDDIKTDGITIRVGNKLLTLTVNEEQNITAEDEYKEELRQKLTQNLLKIGDYVKNKLNDMSNFVDTLKLEYERKQKVLDKKLNNSSLMPDITQNHAAKGLSVVKGPGRDSLIFLVQGVYWPKYLDNDIIDPKYAKRMINHVIFTVETKGKSVINVLVKRPIGLDDFSHYHERCWGNWKWPKTWNTPEDIIKIAHDAEAVLEVINTNSLAIDQPQGLMRISTLRNHLTGKRERVNINPQTKRTGIDNNLRHNDIWEVEV